jgi:hypothetical protein
MRGVPTGLVLLAAFSSPAQAVYEERLTVEPDGVLEIDVDLGEGLRPDPGFLFVASQDLDEVRVEAEASGWGAWSTRFELRGEGRRARFVASVGGTFSWLFGGPQLRVRVWVPREFSLDVRTSGGPIRIEEVTGEIRARTRDAPIELRSAEGSARLRTTDGAILVSEMRGPVELRTGDGPIEVSWVAGAVDARTGSGTVEVRHVDGGVTVATDDGAIEVREVSGRVEARTERGSILASFLAAPSGVLETRWGSIDVFVPNGAGAVLDADSPGGEVEIASGLGFDGEHAGARARGRLGAGGAPLRLYTARGLVRVSAR